MDRLTRADHQLGRIERDAENLRRAHADRSERALHPVVADEHKDGPVRLDHLSDRVLESTIRGRLVEYGEVTSSLTNLGDSHLAGDGANVSKSQCDDTRQGWAHHKC